MDSYWPIYTLFNNDTVLSGLINGKNEPACSILNQAHQHKKQSHFHVTESSHEISYALEADVEKPLISIPTSICERLFNDIFQLNGKQLVITAKQRHAISAWLHPFTFSGYGLAGLLKSKKLAANSVAGIIKNASLSEPGNLAHIQDGLYDNHVHLNGVITDNQCLAALLRLPRLYSLKYWHTLNARSPESIRGEHTFQPHEYIILLHIQHRILQDRLGSAISLSRLQQDIHYFQQCPAICFYLKELSFYISSSKKIKLEPNLLFHARALWNQFIVLQDQGNHNGAMLCYWVIIHLLMDSGSEQIKRILWSQAILLNRIRDYVTASQGQGLGVFVTFFNSILRDIPAAQDGTLAYFKSVAQSTLGTGSYAIEGRISPTMLEQRAEQRALLTAFEEAGIKYHPRTSDENHLQLRIHFIRQKDAAKIPEAAHGFIQPRHWKLRQKLQQQVRTIKHQLFWQRPRLFTNKIVGFDVAGDENLTPPEVFAPTIRELRQPLLTSNSQRNKNPNLSIHAGEDFLVPVTGMRRIDECIKYYEMSSGDRIGHGLAIGICVRDWSMQHDMRFHLSKQEHLDNLVWLEHRINQLPSHEKLDKLSYARKLQLEIGQLCHDIYQQNYSCQTLYAAWEKRKNNLEAISPLNRRREKDESDELLFCYHRNVACRRRGSQTIQRTIEEDDIVFWTAIQDQLIEECVHKDICIEANPSSNCSVAGLTMDKHPVFRWSPIPFFERKDSKVNPFGIRTSALKVVICTDDPGLFSTDLPTEYRKLRDIATNEYHTSPELTDHWLERLAREARQQYTLTTHGES